MGIKCLLKFIIENYNLIRKTERLTYKNKKIAIDISILIYRIVISVRNSGADFTNQKGEITSHILGLFNKTIELLHAGIIPVYVFDGKPPDIKNKTIEDRRLIRKKALEKLENAITEEDKIKYFKRSSVIYKEQWDQCKELLEMMGVPYIVAPEEADSQCAYLAKTGLVDAVFTEDMDILTFGAPKIVRNLTSHKVEISEIVLEEVLQEFDLTQEQFIEFCILLGSDYNEGIYECKPNVILNYYKKHKNIEDTLDDMKKDNIKVPLDFEYKETKLYFMNPKIVEVNEDYLQLHKPDSTRLLKKLVNDYGLIKYLIKTKLDRLDTFYLELQ
jgi:flap endonuclease-1